MALDPNDLLQIRDLIDTAIEKTTTAQDKRLTLMGAFGTLLGAILIAVFAWGLTSAREEVKSSAIDSAKNEARNEVAKDTLVQLFQAREQQAADEVVRARSDASAATDAASTAKSALNNLKR
jgi:hypothetical protein